MNTAWHKEIGSGNEGERSMQAGAAGRTASGLVRAFVLFVSFAGMMFGTTNAHALACTSAATGNWAAAATWAAPCNIAGGPVAADTVTIAVAHTVTVAAAAAATSLTVTGALINNSTLTLSTTLAGTGGLTNSATGILNIGGNATITTLTAAAVGNTVNYTGVAQTAKVTTYSNLTLSGSGAKTFATTPTVNGVLSLEGTATVVATAGVVTYGAAATLQYNTATARTTTLEEWPATFAATGGVIVKNTGVITLNANKVLNNGVPLSIDSGATLTTANRTLNVGGDLSVNGTLTGTSGAITLSGTAPRTIGGTGSIIATTTGTLLITTSRSILNTANLTIARPTTLSAATTVTNNGIINKTTTAALNGANATTSIWVNAAGSTLNYTGTNAPMATGVLTASAAGNTVNYNGAAQTVKVPSGAPATYYDLTLSGSGVKTMPATAMTVARNFTMSGTVATSATAAQALTVGGNFTLNALNTFSAGSFMHSVGGNWANSGTFTAGTSTVTFNGAAAQTIGGTVATSFNNLTIANTGAGSTVLGINTSIVGNLSVNSGTLNLATFTANRTAAGGVLAVSNGAALKIGGTNSCPSNYTTHTLGASSTVEYSGSSQTVCADTYGNLTLSGSGGNTLAAGSTAVSGTLTLGSNNLTTGANTLTLAASCAANGGSGSLSRTSGYVIGNLQLTFPTTASTCIYHVGDSTGYAPVTVVLGATAGGTLTGRVDAGDHPDTTSSASGIDATKSANHYWTLTGGTLPSSVSYSAAFQFCANTGSCTATEVDVGATTGSFNVALKSSGIWSTRTAGTRNAYSTQATGITGFGEFAVGEISTNNCFSDSFTGVDGASPGTNWSVGNKTGTFGNPVIFGNRLRLTDATQSVATWATLQRMIPAAGNKVTVAFDHFAYGGTHADGIGVILSDASVAPQVGAFGGSLGYAQKGYTPISDCTTLGGCPGFTGGWLGIGIDEYGNYSANTEGRDGGSVAAKVNSVAIRGSGSGISGYRFLQGTNTLSPAIDSVAVLVPPHRYRIVVDHTDGVHAWTSVERDANGGGTAYTILLGCPPGVTSGCTTLDVKDPSYSQNAVPTNWNLSFTGSTGASTNIHEIDNLSICTVQGLATPTLHHIKIEHGGTSCTSTPATVTVKACADAACSTLYMNSVTVNLSATPGGTWAPLSPITFSGGQTTVTLTDATARADTLGATATSPTAGYATQCFNGATQTCILTFAACTFDVIEAGAAASTPIFTKLASTAFSLDVLSLSAASQTATAVTLVDSSSGSCSTYASLAASTTAVPSTFTANQRKAFSFTYANAAPNVRVRVTTAANVSCSSDNFAIRPTSFTVTSSATQAGSSGTPVFRAGTDTFSLTATAATSLYTGTPKLNSSLITTSLANLGNLSSVSFLPATLGASTVSGITYSEVGNFNLSQYAVYDDAFAQVDSVKGECTSNFNNGPAVGGQFGCMFGSAAAGPFGRFVPDHFMAVGTVSNACAVGAFTYMGQPFTVSTNVVEARNAANGVTKNYVAPYAPGSVSFGAENADNGTDLLARLTLPAGSWTLGAYTLASANATFTRPTTTTSDATWGSFESLDIGLKVTDGDVSTVPIVSGADMNPVAAGGSSFTYKKFSGSPLRMRFGRLKLSNAHGSELLKLPVQVQAQYWNGTAFAINAADSCTVLSAANIALGNYQRKTGDTWTTSPTLANTAAIAGVWQVNLAKPSATFTGMGSVDMCVDLGADPASGTVCSATTASLPYLQGLWSPGTAYDNDPAARATFGVYKGNNEFIYLRESY